MRHRSKERFIQKDIDVKDWAKETPSMDECRPARCPGCDTEARSEGKIQLHGHGIRRRQVRGPLAATVAPGIVEIALRRYRCQPCSAVIEVGPRGLLRRRVYSASAIGLALARWGVLGESASAVRLRVNPWRIVGDAAAGSWHALKRWARAICERKLWPEAEIDVVGVSLRSIACHAATHIAALAQTEGTALERAFEGAVFAT